MEEAAEKSDKPPDGMITFTDTDQGSMMSITGTYADRLQSAAFAMIQGLADLADRIAEGGAAGTISPAPHKGASPMPRHRDTPRRLRESTGHGELR